MRMVWFVIATVCACSSPDPEIPQPSHAPHMGALARAIQQDDEAVIAQYNDGLLAAGEAGDGDAAARLGAAQGFLRVAADPTERREAFVAIAQACGSCHGQMERPAYAPTGEPALDSALAQVVFPAGAPAPVADLERALNPAP